MRMPNHLKAIQAREGVSSGMGSARLRELLSINQGECITVGPLSLAAVSLPLSILSRIWHRNCGKHPKAALLSLL